jgi:hypothetical protein
MRALRSATLLALVVGLSAGPSAQGLADAARRASTAPQQSAIKKYTNDDVETAKPVPPAPAAAAAASSEAAAAETPKSEAATTAGAPASAEEVKSADPERKQTPKYMANRIALLKAQLSNKEKQLRDHQARGVSRDAGLLTMQIGKIQSELKHLEAHAKPRD